MTKQRPTQPTMRQIAWSVLAAMFGVQKSEVCERDFSSGNPWPYVVIGVLFAILFVLLIVLVVHIVLSSAN